MGRRRPSCHYRAATAVRMRPVWTVKKHANEIRSKKQRNKNHTLYLPNNRAGNRQSQFALTDNFGRDFCVRNQFKLAAVVAANAVSDGEVVGRDLLSRNNFAIYTEKP